jgi:hypothetical protein
VVVEGTCRETANCGHHMPAPLTMPEIARPRIICPSPRDNFPTSRHSAMIYDADRLHFSEIRLILQCLLLAYGPAYMADKATTWDAQPRIW